MRSRSGVFAIALLCPALAATAQVPQSDTKELFVNGRQVKGTLLVSGDRQYVSLDDLARSLEGSLSYQGNKIMLSLRFSSGDEKTGSPSVTVADAAPGTIKGTLAYHHSGLGRDVPDSGTQVFLFKGRMGPLASDTFFVPLPGTNTILIGQPAATFHSVKSTIVDGVGNYEILGVLPGDYTLIFRSGHKQAINKRDISGIVQQFDITIKEAETIQKSFIFP